MSADIIADSDVTIDNSRALIDVNLSYFITQYSYRSLYNNKS